MPTTSCLLEECCDAKEDLVSVLESYTRALGALCGGLKAQGEDEDLEDVDVGPDTLTSLEEMTGECEALLEYLEAGDNGFEEDDGVASANDDLTHEVDVLQQHQTQELDRREELANELDKFADELTDFLSCLEGPSIEEIVPIEAPSSSIHVIADTMGHSQKEEQIQSCVDNNNPASVIDSNARFDSGVPGGTNETNSSDKNEVFSDRTKKAITLHIKRLALQNQRRCGTGTRFRISTKSSATENDTEHEENPGVKVVWSKYQTMSFQQHIMRQKFARRREQQIQEAQRRDESARLKGSKLSSHHRAKLRRGKLSDRAAQHATYLNQFKPNSAHPVSSSEFEPRYLCAVYLYGLRRLGTTFVTFSSLAQFEQRVRARFGINEVVSIYREVTEVVIPEPALERLRNQKRHVKRLQRVSSLRNVNDGDTLCVTQNAYDDMTILCAWIKRRQCILHSFQYELNQPATDVSSASLEVLTPTKQKAKGNTSLTSHLWDSNGRSIGVKPQHDF